MAQFRPNFGILAVILSQVRYSEARIFFETACANGFGPGSQPWQLVGELSSASNRQVDQLRQNSTGRNPRDAVALGSLASR
ncbi:MAG: hypothetical protein ACXW6K_19400, partial [Candidatus Binatia bacterium]